MAKGRVCVISIRREIPLSNADALVADFAYTLWQSSAFFGSSPEAAFFTALRMVKGKSSAGLFLVLKRKQTRSIIAKKSHRIPTEESAGQ
jgi:hypothetical protein